MLELPTTAEVKGEESRMVEVVSRELISSASDVDVANGRRSELVVDDKSIVEDKI